MRFFRILPQALSGQTVPPGNRVAPYGAHPMFLVLGTQRNSRKQLPEVHAGDQSQAGCAGPAISPFPLRTKTACPAASPTLRGRKSQSLRQSRTGIACAPACRTRFLTAVSGRNVPTLLSGTICIHAKGAARQARPQPRPGRGKSCSSTRTGYNALAGHPFKSHSSIKKTGPDTSR